MTTIMLVEDETQILKSLTSMLKYQEYKVRPFAEGRKAVESFRKENVPLVITDLYLGDMSGHDLITQIKDINPSTEVIVITGQGTVDDASKAITKGAYSFITKPFRMESFFLNVKKALNHRSLVLENRRYQERSINVLKAMITTLEHRDTYTAGHSRRVTEIAVSIAEKMNMEPCDIKRVRLASTVHDIGKVGIPDAILRKPGPLTTEEYEVVKLHPEKGRSIIEPLGFLKESLPCILHHHEKFDGSGYPTGLSGYEIPLGSRIIAVADTVDAITSSRAYRDARAMEKALDELKKFSKIQFDPEIVEVFVSLQDE